MKSTYRINIIVNYYFDNVNVNHYRQPIFDLLTNIAWLYRLEYAISENHDFGLDEGEADLFYFRSTDQTYISRKDFDEIVTTLFRNGLSILSEGVDVARQYYKNLPQYPFPTSYYKPLNYPYTEVHNGDKVTLCICPKALQEVIDYVDNSQNSNLHFS
ncbi:MAG: hypothetical protein SNG38_08325 [Rikenellaceae bacterium]